MQACTLFMFCFVSPVLHADHIVTGDNPGRFIETTVLLRMTLTCQPDTTTFGNLLNISYHIQFSTNAVLCSKTEHQ